MMSSNQRTREYDLGRTQPALYPWESWNCHSMPPFACLLSFSPSVDVVTPYFSGLDTRFDSVEKCGDEKKRSSCSRTQWLTMNKGHYCEGHTFAPAFVRCGTAYGCDIVIFSGKLIVCAPLTLGAAQLIPRLTPSPRPRFNHKTRITTAA